MEDLVWMGGGCSPPDPPVSGAVVGERWNWLKEVRGPSRRKRRPSEGAKRLAM